MKIVVALLFAFFGCGAARAQAPLPIYDLNVQILPPQRQLVVTTTVTLPPVPQARTVIPFRLRNDMEIRGVEARGVTGPARWERRSMEGTDAHWEIILPERAPAGRSLTIQVRHVGGQTVGLNHYIGPEVVFTGGGTTAWYPQFEEGRGTGRLTLSMPTAFTGVATGTQVSEHRTIRQRELRFEADWPVQFGFVVGPFHVVRGSGGRQVSVFELQERQASELVSVAERSIGVLEQDFGPFPFRSFAIVEIPSGPGGQAGFLGAAFDGFMLMRSDYLESKGADPSFFGHEIGHQWWGVSVGRNGDGGDYMMDEALAQWGSLRVVEALQGAEMARRMRAGEGDYLGREDALNLIAAGFDRPLANLPHEPGYYELSDSKGYLAWDLIARRVGIERFRAHLRQFAVRHAHSEVSWASFRRHLEQSIGAAERSTIAQWLDRPGLPLLSFEWQATEQGARVQIIQGEPTYQLEVPLRLSLADGSAQMQTIAIASGRTDAELQVPGRVVSVVIDPEHTIPFGVTDQVRAATDAVFATRGRLLWDNGNTPGAEQEFRAGLAVRSSPFPGPGEFLERFYLGWILDEAGDHRAAIDQFEAALRLPVADEGQRARVLWRLSRAAQAAGDSARARWAAQAVVAREQYRGPATILTRRALAFLEAG